MKAVIVHILVVALALLSLCAHAQELGVRTNAPTLTQRMAAFESGEMTLDQLTESPKWDDELVAYYQDHKDEVPVKWKLPISRCLAGLGRYAEAAKVATEYLDVYSNSARGWRIVGQAQLMETNYNEAIVALTNAINLGDTFSYKVLGAAALGAGRTNLLRDIVVPHLLKDKDAKGISKDEKLDMALILVCYSLQANQQEIFVQSLKGLTASDILERGDLPSYVRTGCERFHDKRIKGICEKLSLQDSVESKKKGADH